MSQPKLSVRLVSADSYQSSPISSLDPSFSEFRGCEIKQVPIIRIFGTTSDGDKVCLHVHGVFPYLYIPCPSNVMDNFVYHLAASLDSALNITLGSTHSSNQHVYKIQQVTGIPFYGYHKKKHKFFKIYLYSPALIKKAAELLQNGSVLGQTFQPHESHIPFILQFMMDYNIYGMSFVNLKDIYYRNAGQPLSGDMFSDETCSLDNKKYLPNSVTRQSVCKLEVDAVAQDIINRQEIENGVDTNPGIAAIWEEEKLRRQLAGLQHQDSQMVCPLSVEREIELPPTANDIYQEERFTRRLLNFTQNTESDASSISSFGSYPVIVNDNDDLLNASNVEDHLSQSRSQEMLNATMQINEDNDKQLSDSQPSDVSLLDLLVGLANDAEQKSVVDEDSILGSQTKVTEHEECDNSDEDEIPDMNLTNLQLDSMSPWEFLNDKAESQKSVNSVNSVPLEMFEEDFSLSENSKNIPAFDGAYDSTSSESDQEVDLTVESMEKRVCAYNSNKLNAVNVTPKRKNAENCGTSNSSLKRGKFMCRVQVTPTRSPRKRATLNSPSSSRMYSPLNVQVVTSPQVDSTKKVPTEQKKLELEVLKSIKKTTSDKNILNLDDNDILAEDSDDSPSNEYHGSPIVTRTMYSKTNKRVARKLMFNKDILSQDETNSPNLAEETLDLVSETSEEPISDIEDINLQITPSTQQITFSQKPPSSTNKCRPIRPKYKPPSRDRIISTMDTYGIPKCRYQEPFYNKEEDVDGQKEVAHKILKVPSKGLSSLQSFISNLDDVQGIDHWRNTKMHVFETTQSSIQLDKLFSDKRNFAGHSLLRITPLTLPPSRKRVETWLKAREILRMKKEKEQRVKTKRKSLIPVEKMKLKNNNVEDGSDSDQTICESPCSNDETLIVENDVVETDIVKNDVVETKLSQPVQSSSELESVDSSVQNMLDNTKLLKSFALSNHYGISCGQIEFSSNSTRDNIEAENYHAKALAKNQYITMLCVELYIDTRDDLLPDPEKDPMKAVFFSVQNDVPSTSIVKPLEYGVIVINNEENDYLPKNYISVEYVKSEQDLIEKVVSLVTRYDPEILIGWELENFSWGYISQRAIFLGLNFPSRISRIPKVKYNWESKALDLETLADFKLPGRIVLEIWRMMRSEIALYSYTFENIMYHILNERIPYYSNQTLTQYWNSSNRRLRCKVVDYYTKKILGILRILEQLDIIGRTSEFARLYGVQFYEVFSRGSQFRVESMMLRLAKPLNYIPVSPSNFQRASMRAPEALPLIMEPESCFYSDPVVVLDFQSLYPSIIIAYNYCFSTCLGRVEHIGQSRPFVFGAATLKVNKNLATELEGKINFSPCGVAFVKSEVRRGILPQMLTEILNTRLMVKKSIKDHSSQDKTLQKVLHSRQLGLKLIANVTYGYTAANFSGRMPCIEVGDSVVSKGKETLERAIKIVETNPKWGARVVYGDTDSLFIILKGKTRQEAFEIGQDMADVITKANPPPVKLKFEKVLQPSILQTKKRYCGYMYENVADEKPVYLAKGIETVRRDGCPAVSKILGKSLKILFETKDVSQVKQYVTRQFDKILQGKVSIQDLTFAREFRGMRGYKQNACVPALELTRRLMKHDPRAVPRHSERVKYVIVAGAPNEALIRCVRTPMEVISDPGLRLNTTYYITRVIIPPLNRCLNLIGADVNLWFNQMPHRQRQRYLEKAILCPTDKQKITISQYFDNAMCSVCGKQTNKEICDDCKLRPEETVIVLTEKIRQMERVNQLINKLCYSCIGQVETVKCESLDCPVFYRRKQTAMNFACTSNVCKLINSCFSLDF